MGYFINTRKRRDGSLAWGLVYRAEADGKRHTKRIRTTDLRQYGFLPSMSADEARFRVKQLNLETKHLQAAERAKLRALAHAQEGRETDARLFPAHLVQEFLETRLKPKFFHGGAHPEMKYKKALSRWRLAQSVVRAADLLPQEWTREPRIFYKWFSDRRLSAGYTSKVITVLNMWGFFVSEKQGKPFLPLPAPRGYDRQVIEDASDEKDEAPKESLPLTPEQLEAAKGKLRPEHYTFVYITLWFGLRPVEVGGQWRVTTKAQKGRVVKVLEVYQTKLTALSKEKRWKRIPILFPEQETALALLQEGKAGRPWLGALRKAFGRGYLLYAGRKGFTDLMLSRGQRIENISRWLGHTSIDQTLRAYKDKERVEFD
jgi:integrase